MSLSPTQTRAAGLDLRRLERGTHQEVFATGLVSPGGSDLDALRGLFTELAATYAAGVQPIQEKVYGDLALRDEVLACRRAAFSALGVDPALPCSYLEGRPVADGALAGLQAWGVVPAPGTPGVVSVAGQGAPGRLWRRDGFALLYLPAVRGLDPQGDFLPGPTAQAEGMFAAAQAQLEAHGFRFRDVRRTWIYLARLLDWYGELNHVRTRFFQEQGVGFDGAFPASTGIQGVSRVGEECLMDVLAIQADVGVPVAPIHHSERQGRAFSYGSAFSRAMRVGGGCNETVFVSGTASIDPQGRTRFCEDADAQVLETLLSISALLEERGGTLNDICQGTLFCKTPQVLAVYEQVTRLLGIPRLPLVPVVADVCRPELLVEIEAVAVVPGKDAA